MTTITTSNHEYSSPAGSQETLQPLPFWGSLIAFGLPALLMIFSYHVFMPRLLAAGLAPAESFVVAHVEPMAIMLAAALAAFSQRFRYPRLTPKAALLGLATFLALNTFMAPFRYWAQDWPVRVWLRVRTRSLPWPMYWARAFRAVGRSSCSSCWPWPSTWLAKNYGGIWPAYCRFAWCWLRYWLNFGQEAGKKVALSSCDLGHAFQVGLAQVLVVGYSTDLP
jgi:hypothetical protein